MNSDTVKTIKRVIPLTVFAWASWYTYRKRENMSESLLFGGVVALLAWALFGPLVDKVVSLSGRPSEASFETKNIPQGWSPEAVTRELRDNIYDTPWDRNNSPISLSLYQRVGALNDDQLKAVYNYWRSAFYTEENETLTQAMDHETYGLGFGGAIETAAARVKSRLKALGCY